MKAKFFSFLVVIIVFGFSSQAIVWPTKIVKVDPDPETTIGALQSAIANNGSAIYELKRGGIYLTNGMYTIPALVAPLIIRAESGTGPRPVIRGGVPSTGYPAGDNVIRINGDIKFEDIYFTGEDMNGVVHKNTIRVLTGTWFEFNGCMFDKDNAASIRNGVGNCVYIFSNCTFRNQVDYFSFSNGRAWDAREAFKNITLIMKNCTFYNISSRIIRTSTSDFDSIIFVNNTCYNIQEALPFGLARKVICNNNIFYNVGLGGSILPTAGILEIDSIGGTANADAARKFDFRNNLFYIDQQYKDLMVSTSLCQRSLLNGAAKAFMISGQLIISDTIKDQSITFTNPPPRILGYVKYLWDNNGPSGNSNPLPDQRIETMEDTLNCGDVVAPKVQFSFGYPTSHQAYSAGLGGDILGDKKWFNKIFHFTQVWTGNGVDQMNINVLKATIDGINLEPGDEIALFDKSLCVGVSKLISEIDTSNILYIKASKDDGSGNGYTPGNHISYRFWDQSTGMEITAVSPFYYSNNPDWSTSGAYEPSSTSFVDLTGLSVISVTIDLKAGWNIFSDNNTPSNPDMKALMQPLITLGKLVKVQDETGNSLEDFGIFGGWINNIGNLSLTEGYKIKVNSPCQLTFTGKHVFQPYKIPLKTGWNIIGYPHTIQADGKSVFHQLITRGTLIKVQDETGNSIEDFGIFGGWVNNIGNFIPGKGFKVKVRTNDTLTVTESYPQPEKNLIPQLQLILSNPFLTR